MVNGWPDITGLDWAPNGKGLYCGFTSPQGRALVYVNLKGRAHVLRRYKGMGGLGGTLFGIPSPDGRYIAILGGAVNSNVWMLEGF